MDWASPCISRCHRPEVRPGRQGGEQRLLPKAKARLGSPQLRLQGSAGHHTDISSTTYVARQQPLVITKLRPRIRKCLKSDGFQRSHENLKSPALFIISRVQHNAQVAKDCIPTSSYPILPFSELRWPSPIIATRAPQCPGHRAQRTAPLAPLPRRPLARASGRHMDRRANAHFPPAGALWGG